MNAHELADELENYVWMNPNNNRDYCKEVKDMLRQQADRIAELEKELAKYPKQGQSIPCANYTTPQIKELSDEEIEEVMYKCDWAYDPVAFARAILKKASEK
jgi:hypothetical protein